MSLIDDAPTSRPGASRVALVIGATGLVGRELVRQLLADFDYDVVRTFVRRPSGLQSERLDERVVAMSDVAALGPALEGEVLFSALGTTRRVAGSTSAQFAVDHDLNLAFAEMAASRGVPAYVLVSAAGASPHSPFFYSRMKGQLERAVERLAFQSIRILKPGLLDGERSESRPAERFTQNLLRGLPKWTALSALRPVPAETVARAMRTVAADWSPGVQVVLPPQIALLGQD